MVTLDEILRPLIAAISGLLVFHLGRLKQVAERQGKYLANELNRVGKASGGHANAAKDIDLGKPFVYKHLGSMATIGRFKALVDLRQSKVKFFNIS